MCKRGTILSLPATPYDHPDGSQHDFAFAAVLLMLRLQSHILQLQVLDLGDQVAFDATLFQAGDEFRQRVSRPELVDAAILTALDSEYLLEDLDIDGHATLGHFIDVV